MGWKKFYEITESNFRDMYNAGQSWGDMYLLKIIAGDKTYYCAGAYTSDTTFKFSPKIVHPVGVKTRITVKFLFLAKENAPVGSSSSIGIVFYKDGDTSKDPSGNDYHGIAISVVQPPPSIHIEEKTLVIEQENDKIKWSCDQAGGEAQLETPLQSFKLAIKIDSNTGIGILNVTAEYYDQIEDIFNMMFNLMIIMMFVMIGVMFLRMILGAFRGKKE